MSLLWRLLCLSVITVHGCVCQKHDDPHQAMLLAVPMMNEHVLQFNEPSEGAVLDIFDCSHPTPPGSRQYFENLQSRGVTHVKVPLSWAQLLPTGLPSHPQRAVVTCYQTLLKQLLEVGLQPLVILHGSTVPDTLRSIYGGWESQELVEMFQKYADFVFVELGDLAETWVTLSSLDELRDAELQNALDAHASVYHHYHQLFPGRDGGVSVGVKASKAPIICDTQLLKNSDFLSIKIQYACTPGQNLAEELKSVLGKCGDKPILFYEVDIKDCYPYQYLSDAKILEALSNGDQNVLVDKLRPADTIQKSYGISDHNGITAFRNSYQDVWNKFGAQTTTERDLFLNESFPAGFQWATSSESFKVEGGWLQDGKGETIWDRFGHENKVFDNQTADLACDSYHKVDYDVYLLRGLHVNTYQFSISWARIFPSGHRASQSEKGALYYDKLINALIESGIQPVVTLYHWDLPQTLQDYGGWTNASIVEAFKDYADFCFSRFGDRVKTWNTFSSPWVVSHAGYGTGEHPPAVKDYVVASYQVTHNMLKSHAEAWHVYNDKYRNTQVGKIGIALNSDWAEPKDPSKPEDIAAADRYLQFMLGWFAHPIFVDGDYPATLKSQIEQKNNNCSTEPARLPVFTAEESKRIHGTADFLGLNHYTSRLINNSDGGCTPGPQGVGDFQAHVDPSWSSTASDWIYSAPWGLRRLLNYISNQYLQVTKVPIHITGNGMPSEYNGDTFNDISRVEFMRLYINEALKAINLDGLNVQRFTVQSLMDGFEGPQGYSERFGLHYVNFDMPDRPRTPKQSAYFYSNIIEQNGFAPEKLFFSAPEMKNTESNKISSTFPPSTVPSQAMIVWQNFSRQSNLQRQIYHYGTFPEGFSWGVSSSAYQIEGGWNADGKGPSVWDTFTHAPDSSIPANANGDVACDSYDRLAEDLYMLRALRVKSYRFSLSWSRIFPDGNRASLNQKGVDYYNRLIDGLFANKITPMVTLYHWDLPQALQDLGGWDNVAMINLFNDFCDFCFFTFGDRVKFWMTFNQPHTVAWLGYGLGLIPPRVKDPGFAPYRVAHNLIKAHATAYHTYNDKYRKTQGGLVSIALNADWIEPKDVNVPREVEAADRALQFQLGWFAHPIFKNGDYPDAMKWQVGNKSELQGFSETRLPSFTEEEKNFIKGTADMFCINHYTTKTVSHVTAQLNPSSYEFDRDVSEADLPYPNSANNQRAVAWGLRRLLNWIKEEYGHPEIYITENGVAEDVLALTDDIERVYYYKTYVDEALKGHDLDGVKVKGYIATSLMDSFEWLKGYQIRHGLHYVDFNNPNRPRTPKRSAHLYHQIIKDNGFPIPDEEKMLYGQFPKGFFWGSASSAYQIEGGWRADGKGLSIWDKFAHTPSKVGNSDNADVACDSYNKIDEDVAVLKKLKVTHYRFSVSWPRVLPDGTNNTINEAGLNYYHRLLDALKAANIVPQVTLYHWDLPQALQDFGGWENEIIVQRFRDYADVLFNRLGDKVQFWITLNEAYIVANLGYGYGNFAPGVVGKQYEAAHNLIKAHAEAWHLYNDKYRAKQGGLISITINSDWAEPRNPDKHEDVESAERYFQFFTGWFAHPIFVGDYPEIMKTVVRRRSLAAGLPKSRLPEFTPAEVERIKGSHDYFGLNHYCSLLSFPIDYGNQQDYDSDRGCGATYDRTWIETGSSWLKITGFGFRRLLKYIKDHYGNPPIYVTENGVSERGAVDLNDEHRKYFYDNYINNALKAVVFDKVDLRSYTAWSLMDNFEWAAGYDERFGLFYVNRSDPKLPRIPKSSASHYASIITCNGFPDPALGPHECLNPEPEATNAPTTTTNAPTTTIKKPGYTSAPIVPPNMVAFLGLDLSPHDAGVALYINFSFLLVSVLGVVFVVYQLLKTRKTGKSAEMENVNMGRM